MNWPFSSRAARVILVLAACLVLPHLLPAHSDPSGDVYPNVRVEDGNFVIEFENNDGPEDRNDRPLLRMVYSPQGALLAPRHVRGKGRKLAETMGEAAKLEAHLENETITFDGYQSTQVGYVLKKAGKEESHRLPWPPDYDGTFEAGCADKFSIGVVTVKDQSLWLSHFERDQFKLPQTVQIAARDTVSFIWNFPVVSNVVRIGARYCIAWPRTDEAAQTIKCVIWTWKPGEEKPKEIILTEPPDLNTHLSVAAIGNRLCLTYHCLTGDFAPTSKIIVVFRDITDDGPR